MAGRLVGDGVSTGSSFVGEEDVRSDANEKDEEAKDGEVITIVVTKTVEAGRGASVVVTDTVDTSTCSSRLISEAEDDLMVVRTSSLGTAVGVVIMNPPIPSVFDIVNMPSEAAGSDVVIVTTFVLVLRTLTTSAVETIKFAYAVDSTVTGMICGPKMPMMPDVGVIVTYSVDRRFARSAYVGIGSVLLDLEVS